MNIKWNEVTPYSKWGAVILFLIIVPALSFFIGIEYQETKDSLNETLVLDTVDESWPVPPRGFEIGIDTQAGDIEITGTKPVYKPGEIITFSFKTIRYDGVVLNPSMDLSAQIVTSTDITDGRLMSTLSAESTLEISNPVYKPGTGTWHAEIKAPTDSSRGYKVYIGLYCTIVNPKCGDSLILSDSFRFSIQK